MFISFSHWCLGKDYQIIELADGSVLLFVCGSHRLLSISRELGERLRNGLHTLFPDEQDEWNRLVEKGIISDINYNSLKESSFSDGANLAINVNLTAFCNLNCTYCFADGGDYGRIKGRMEATTVDHIFEFINQYVTSSQKVRFEFFGGEPLLNFNIIKEICDRSEQTFKANGIEFIYRISTNLTVLPCEAVDLFAKKNFIVSVSIDGDEETHNRNRPAKNGEGSFKLIMNNVQVVRNASKNIILVARMTVTNEKPSLTDNVIALWKLNIFDYFQIYPAVTPAENKPFFVTLKSKTNQTMDKSGNTIQLSFYKQLSAFIKVYPTLFSKFNRFRGVLEYERIVDMIQNGKLALAYCSGGRNYFTISPDNSIMPCHRLVGDKQFQCGNGSEGITTDLDQWREMSVDNHHVCSKCWIRYICGGGCKQENFVAMGSLNEPNPDMCKYQIQMVETLIETMVREGKNYRTQNRFALEDLFVSCGRPVIEPFKNPIDDFSIQTNHFHII